MAKLDLQDLTVLIQMVRSNEMAEAMDQALEGRDVFESPTTRMVALSELADKLTDMWARERERVAHGRQE